MRNRRDPPSDNGKPNSQSNTQASAHAQLKSFVDKFTPEHRSLIRATRRWLRVRLPSAHELVYDNYNFFVIGYSPTERPSDAVISIAASSNGVGLCFIHGKGLPDPAKLMKGSGNQTRSVHLEGASALQQPALGELVDEAIRRARVPFAQAGKGLLVIRSVSAKQRPRRRAEWQ
jgi:hypothetical protein